MNGGDRHGCSSGSPRYGRPALGSRYFGRTLFRPPGPKRALYPLGEEWGAWDEAWERWLRPKLSLFYFFGDGPLRPKRPVEVVELPDHRLRRHISWWLGGFGTPGPCQDGACTGPSVTAQNAVLTKASCSRGFHGHARPARAPRDDAPPTSKN